MLASCNMKNLGTLVSLLRMKEWVKNLFVLTPVFFAKRFNAILEDFSILLAFSAFCGAASAIYIFNDWIDAPRDRLHPTKKKRPFAAGNISAIAGLSIALGLALIASVMALASGVLVLLVTYIVINLAYSLGLKHVALLDIFAISAGFVIRVLVGGVAGKVDVSKWIILLTFLLSMCLALGKRRNELQQSSLSNGDFGTRPALAGYNLEFVNVSTGMLSAITIVCYVMYSMSKPVALNFGSDYVFYTSVFVLFGLLRYMQIVFVEEKTWTPTEVLLGDSLTQFNLAMWAISFVWIIYL